MGYWLWLKRPLARLNQLVFDFRLYQPTRAIAALIAIMAVRALVDDIYHAFGGPGRWSMFFDPADLFADFAKVATAYKFAFTDVMAKAEYSHWPRLFQDYLLNNLGAADDSLRNINDPHSHTITTLHIPPLSAIIFVLGAMAMAGAGPMAAVLGFMAAYLALGLAMMRIFACLCDARGPVMGFCGFALCLSYPAIWMLTRENVAGFVMLLVFLYLLTLWADRWRWIGWIALGLALNMRPEPALLVLLELPGKVSVGRKLARMVAPGVAAAVIGALSLQAMHALYPVYTIDHFFKGLAIYHRVYAQGSMGNDWNVSLQFLPRWAGRALGMGPGWNAITSRFFCFAGAAALVLGARKAARQGMDRHEWLFFLTALPPLVLPVTAYYHMLRVMPLMVFLMLDLSRRPPMPGDRRLTLLGLAGLIASPLGTNDTHGPMVALVLLAGCVFVMGRTDHAGADRLARVGG